MIGTRLRFSPNWSSESSSQRKNHPLSTYNNMATTWSKPIHIQADKPISQTITSVLDYEKDKKKTCLERNKEMLKIVLSYDMDAEKTNDGELVTSWGCSVDTAAEEWALAHMEYTHITGRTQKNGIAVYRMRQAFKPGEITPQKANQLGHELAQRYLRGYHAYTVTTHVNTAHIHNHISFNAVAIDCMSKYHEPLRSHKIIARISDQICLEHGLSVVERPKQVKYQNMEEWTKGKALGVLVDLENSIKAQVHGGYQHWANIFNTKEAAKTLLFLQEHNLTDLQQIDWAVDNAKSSFEVIVGQIKQVDARLDQIKTMQQHIGTYSKTKDIYRDYQRAKDKRIFYNKHEVAIDAHESAKKYFDNYALKSLPSIGELKQEFAMLTAEKGKLYKEFHPKKAVMQKMIYARANAELMLNKKVERGKKKIIDKDR